MHACIMGTTLCVHTTDIQTDAPVNPVDITMATQHSEMVIFLSSITSTTSPVETPGMSDDTTHWRASWRGMKVLRSTGKG